MQKSIKLLGVITLLFACCFCRLIIQPKFHHYVIGITAPNGNDWALLLQDGKLSYINPAQGRANDCIEASDGTDSDICDCLHAQGLEDKRLCK